MDQIERWCATRADQADRLDMAIEDIGTDEYAGELSLNGIDADNESAGVRIALIRKYQGRGYGVLHRRGCDRFVGGVGSSVR